MPFFEPHCHEPRPWGQNAGKFSSFFMPAFAIYLSRFDLLNFFNFSKISLMDSLEILSLGIP